MLGLRLSEPERALGGVGLGCDSGEPEGHGRERGADPVPPLLGAIALAAVALAGEQEVLRELVADGVWRCGSGAAAWRGGLVGVGERVVADGLVCSA